MKNVFILLFGFFPILSSVSQDFGSPVLINDNDYVEHSMDCSDLDGDDDIDLLSVQMGAYSIRIYENEGFGGFLSYQIETEGFQVLMGYFLDVDKDNDADIILYGSFTDKEPMGFPLVYLLNDGAGSFDVPTELVEFEGGTFSMSLSDREVFIDIDLDGDKDFIGSNAFDATIYWQENQGDLIFGESQLIDDMLFQSSALVGGYDLDNDGDFDVVSSSSSELVWYENLGSGNFDEKVILRYGIEGISSFYVMDMDGDSDLDVIEQVNLTSHILWYANDGEGNFGYGQVVNDDGLDGHFILMDIDADDDLDVLIGIDSEDGIYWCENIGSGNFTNSELLIEGITILFDPLNSDLDGDGDVDLLSRNDMLEAIWFDADSELTLNEIDVEEILLYPNPMTESCTVHFKDNALRTVSIIDNLGRRRVHLKGVHEKEIEFFKRDLESGRYQILISQEDSSISCPLIIE